MADKLLLTASFVTLAYLKVLPFWIAAVVISRDVILVVGTLLVYMLVARYLHLPLVPRFVLWLAAAFTVISGLQYIVQGMNFLEPGEEREESREDAIVR